MRHEYLLEKDKVDTHRSRPRSKDTEEAVTDRSRRRCLYVGKLVTLPSNADMTNQFSKTSLSVERKWRRRCANGGRQLPEEAPPAEPQKGGSGKRNANPLAVAVRGGCGTLASISGQLHQAEGYASKANAPIGLVGRVSPQRQADGTYRVQVQWRINGATTLLPRWVDYDNSCVAAQTEWDRFMVRILYQDYSLIAC
jgi:hypothetical protein